MTRAAKKLRLNSQNSLRRGKPRGMTFEALERREVFAAITGNTAPGGFEALNSLGLTYWLRPDAGVSTSGSAVTSWTNQGTGAVTFSQANANKQPTLVAGGIGGQPSIQFDGDANNGLSDELDLNSSATVRSIFIVNTTTGSNQLAGIWGLDNADTGIRRDPNNANNWSHPGNGNDFSNAGAMAVNGVNGINPSAPLGTAHVLTAINPGGAAYSSTSIGDYFVNSGRSWGGQIGDVLAFNRVLNAAERLVVENSLAAKYGISFGAIDIYAGDDVANGNYDRDVFGIAGVQSAASNIALGKPATQSSEYGGFPASNAVDGNTGNFTHTNSNDTAASWSVDLGANSNIDSIKLFNRGGGCCQYRFRDLTVEVRDASNSVVYTSPVLNPGDSLGGPATLTVSPGVSGRYVKVSRASLPGGGDDNNVLSLGEVQVFSSNPEFLTSAGSSGFGIEAINNSLAIGESVMAGHNGAANALVTTNLPSGVTSRFARDWYVDKTGSVDANLAFDFSDAGLTAPAASITDYKLLYRATASGNYSVVNVAPTINGDTITFAVSDADLADGYYTLGRDNAATAGDDSFTMLQNTTLSDTVADNDVDLDNNAVYSVSQAPTKGVLALNPATGAFTYTPNTNFTGTDTFKYKLTDFEGSAEATVTINVSNVVVTDGVMYVMGTTQNDRIVIYPNGQVRFNNKLTTWDDVTEKVVVFGNAGADNITTSGTLTLPVEFYGGDGNDYLQGSVTNDLLDGGAGTDRLLGGNGDDQLYGGAGTDTLNGGNGDDLLDGDRYYDLLGGTEIGDLLLPAANLQGKDTMNGDAGNDVLYGQGGNDAVSGNAGDDLLVGGDGTDTIKGGAGNDLVYGSDLDGTDNTLLASLAMTWFSGDPDTAASDLGAAAIDDGLVDNLSGEVGDDTYLVYLMLDKITTPAEKKSPNVTIELS
jgi:Ca2+-binding RTX toxin-like protein